MPDIQQTRIKLSYLQRYAIGHAHASNGAIIGIGLWIGDDFEKAQPDLGAAMEIDTAEALAMELLDIVRNLQKEKVN